MLRLAPLLIQLPDLEFRHCEPKDRERYQKQIQRAKVTGFLRIKTADEICIRVLHLHPFEVYGDDWLDDSDF